jgi:hypothetical protein
LTVAARSEIFYKELLSLAKLLAGGNTVSETRLDGLRPDAELPSHPRRAGKSFVGTLRELDSGRRRYDVALVSGFNFMPLAPVLAGMLTGKPCVVRPESPLEVTGSDPHSARPSA